MEQSPREKIINSFSGEEVDYGTLMEVLNSYVSQSDAKDNRYVIMQKEMNELLEPDNDMLDEPYEKARKLGILVDSYNILAHIYEKSDRNKFRFLMSQKDFFMTKLAEYCLDNNITVGFTNTYGYESLEVDIPRLGHIGWHFGNRKNLHGCIVNTDYRLREYMFDVEPKMTSEGIYSTPYSNAELLLGTMKPKIMNKTDRNLVLYGKIHPKEEVEF